MKPYSPFSKTIHDVEIEDLSALRSAAEGWYIEYKIKMPNATSIAKSISALANTYGGWLFIGINEDSKENPVARDFPGISRSDSDAALQRIRKSAADLISPTPFFETKVIWGPDSDLELPEDHGIICVWVPQSVNAPHVHKSGVIYRRVSDASEPRPENDRFVLDQLWKRIENVNRRHREWHERDPEFSEHEKRQPYVRIMIICDRFDERDVWIDAKDKDFHSVFCPSADACSIPFDTVYTSAGGIIGRQLTGNDPFNLGLTWRLKRNLQSDIIIPLPFYNHYNLNSLKADLHGYQNAEYFTNILSRYQISVMRIVDLNYMFSIFIGIANIIDRLCDLAKWPDSYYFKIKLLNTWRTIPFIDVLSILNGFDKNGLSMCLDSNASLPRGTDYESYTEIHRYYDIESANSRLLIQACLMFLPLAISFGIPSWVPNHSDSEDISYYTELYDAGQRAIEVQRRRNTKI